jgi:hypothetical protein
VLTLNFYFRLLARSLMKMLIVILLLVRNPRAGKIDNPHLD